LCAIPCASVSAKRTRTSVAKLKSTGALYDRAHVRFRPRRADPRQAAVRRPDRGGREHGERYPGLPLGDRALGGVRPARVRDARGLQERSAQGLELLQAADRGADRGRAQPGAPCAGGARAARLRRGDRHAEHRPAARARREPRGRRGARLDPNRELPRGRRAGPAGSPGGGEGYPLELVLELLETNEAPACPACGRVLKPDVVFFGELLPVEAIDRATELARGAALLLVVGSALEVYPVAGLPLETLAAGGALAIVNRGPTPFDGEAALRVDGSAGEILPQVLDALRLPRA